MPHFSVIDAADAPHFDGATYEPAADHKRLFEQLQRVYDVMCDGQWHTVDAVALRARCPAQSAGARMRDLRKAKWGAHVLERKCVGHGLNYYRLEVNDAGRVILGRSA